MSNLVDRYDRNNVITEEIIINEWESCKLVKECLPDLQCVYAVSANRRVVYIGSTISLNDRLWLYLNDNPISKILHNKHCPAYLTSIADTTSIITYSQICYRIYTRH